PPREYTPTARGGGSPAVAGGRASEPARRGQGRSESESTRAGRGSSGASWITERHSNQWNANGGPGARRFCFSQSRDSLGAAPFETPPSAAPQGGGPRFLRPSSLGGREATLSKDGSGAGDPCFDPLVTSTTNALL